MDSITWELRNVIAYRDAFRHASHTNLSFFRTHLIPPHTQYIRLLEAWKSPSPTLFFSHVRSNHYSSSHSHYHYYIRKILKYKSFIH